MEIFVFGSNLAGRHGKGAALDAKRYHGAINGRGFGMQGSSYAIPTKDANLTTLSLDRIKPYVITFVRFARDNPDLNFFVTRVGCGLAGYTDQDIAPMFKAAPANCQLPQEWKQYYGNLERNSSTRAQWVSV